MAIRPFPYDAEHIHHIFHDEYTLVLGRGSLELSCPKFTFIILLILYIAKWQIVWTALQFRLITFSVLFNLGFNKTILKCLHFDALIERIYQADS
jgi:hypothetical protein